jgi:ABC-type nitrate/sulfonate/bicarbonate transport system ATPase subunit
MSGIERRGDIVSVPALTIQNMHKTFYGAHAAVKALDDLSLQVEPGEFVTLIGPSGSGKSTLFNLIAGLLDPDEGEIVIDREADQDRIGRVGYMPQRDLLLPWRNILNNVVIPQEIKGHSLDEARAAALELFPLFGLEGFAEHYPFALSGGMRQRAALLRTILTNRNFLLLDEPFGALDALSRRELQDWLLDLWRHFRQTILFITHDVEEALYLGDRVVVLSPRPGRILLTLDVTLPRPRRQGMIALPQFGEQVKQLLDALGVAV